MTTIGLLHPGQMSGGLPDGFHRGASDVYLWGSIEPGALRGGIAQAIGGKA